MATSEVESLVLELHSMDCIRFGSFVLKSGVESPFYFDMRAIVSYPATLRRVASVMWSKHSSPSTSPVLCGVPYTALPIATVLSVDTNTAMLVRRKEKKAYGTARMLEGHYREGQECLIIEDVVTTGSSVVSFAFTSLMSIMIVFIVLETAELLRSHGLTVKDALVFLDRQQGGRENLRHAGIELHSVVDLTMLNEIMLANKKISKEQFDEVGLFISRNKDMRIKVDSEKEIEIQRPRDDVKRMTLDERRSISSTSMAKAFFTTMIEKESNLCVALDVTLKSELFKLIELLGPLVCCFKLHADILEDFNGDEDALRLRNLAKKHKVWLMEDRKLADIGQVASMQLFNTRLGVDKWANLVTVHAVAGPGVFDAIYDKCKEEMGVVVVAEMSSDGNLMNSTYAEQAVNMLSKGKNAFGLVCQSKELSASKPELIQFVPGVNLEVKSDKLGQRYVNPEEAVLDRGADVIIVGRGIVASGQAYEKAQSYRKAGWDGLLKRMA